MRLYHYDHLDLYYFIATVLSFIEDDIQIKKENSQRREEQKFYILYEKLISHHRDENIHVTLFSLEVDMRPFRAQNGTREFSVPPRTENTGPVFFHVSIVRVKKIENGREEKPTFRTREKNIKSVSHH